MGEKTGVSLSLERKQLDWLEIMSKKYGLPTPGKAFRIVILYTKQKEHDAADIFAKVQSIVDDDSTLVNSLQKLDDVHDCYLQELVSKYGLGSKDKAARVVLDYAMTSGDESTIFEVKRCRHGSTCKNC
ncbi:unnamed protein product [Sphagnum jensenii]|uniref:Uncharacterized protein n=1 Tax=Sphagnum jensenii TaxID=128206 RepID=A0ABP1BK86_9BRYO